MRSLPIVDDSASIRQAVRITLSGRCHFASEAANGSEGVQKATTEKFELIITDLNVSVVNGLSMSRHTITRANRVIGLRADKVHEVTRLDHAAPGAAPVGACWRRYFIRCLAKRNGDFVVVPNLPCIFSLCGRGIPQAGAQH